MLKDGLRLRGRWWKNSAIGKDIVGVNRDFEDLLRCLNHAKARYLVVGAYAVIFYTEPRYTKDLDLWIELSPENSERVYNALKKFGAPLKGLTPNDFSRPGFTYQIGIEPNRIDILMGIDDLIFEKAWERHRITKYGGQKAAMIGIDDLIKNKHTVGRAQDLIDTASLKRVKKIHQSKSQTSKKQRRP